MEKHIILKEEILRQYKSVRAFSKEMDIPYSTLATALSGNMFLHTKPPLVVIYTITLFFLVDEIIFL